MTRKTEPVGEAGRTITRPPSLRVIGQRSDGKVVLLDPDTPNWTAVSPAVATFISLLDGQTNAEDVRRAFKMDSGGLESEAAYSRLVRALLDVGMLQYSGETAAPAIRYAHPRGTLEAVTLYLTSRCNLSCRYCFYDAEAARNQELSTDEWARVIDELACMEVGRVFFMGGEPLMRKDTITLARHAKRKGLEVTLITNGTMIDQDLAKQVHELFAGVQVSLDGLRREHDFVRGAGSFGRAWRGIQNLLDIGAPVTVSCILSRRNIELMDDFVAFLIKRGVPRFHCLNLQTHGRGSCYQDMAISFGQFTEKLYQLHRQYSEQITMKQIEALINVRPFHRKESCGVGRATIEVNANGDIYPCYKLMSADYLLGSIRTTRLADVYSHSDALQRLGGATVEKTAECRACDVRYFCGGGCLLDRLSDDHGDACAEIQRFWKWVLVHTHEGQVIGQDFSL